MKNVSSRQFHNSRGFTQSQTLPSLASLSFPSMESLTGNKLILFFLLIVPCSSSKCLQNKDKSRKNSPNFAFQKWFRSVAYIWIGRDALKHMDFVVIVVVVVVVVVPQRPFPQGKEASHSCSVLSTKILLQLAGEKPERWLCR